MLSVNGRTPVMVQDENGDQVGADTVSRGIITISTEHDRIHDGNHFTCQDYDEDVDIATPKYWHFKTSATLRDHLVFSLRAVASGVVEFFEEPTLTDDGVGLTCQNNDRESTNTASSNVYENPTVSADGTRLLVNVVGSNAGNAASREGGVTSRAREFILKKSTSYIVKFTTDDNDDQVSCCFEWYETEAPN